MIASCTVLEREKERKRERERGKEHHMTGSILTHHVVAATILLYGGMATGTLYEEGREREEKLKTPEEG